MSAAAANSLCFKPNPAPPFPSRAKHLHPSYPIPLFLGNHYICICWAFSPSNSSSSSSGGEKPLHYGPQEEARWLREEQRWLREEQRWLRQECRWNEEREVLISEIERLKLQKQEFEHMNSIQESLVPELTNIAKVLQYLKEGELTKTMNRIPESGSGAQPIVSKLTMEEKNMIMKEIIEVPQQTVKHLKKRKTLRIGSEGDEVKSMQKITASQKAGTCLTHALQAPDLPEAVVMKSLQLSFNNNQVLK